ncbi:MAG: hypothetical protein VSS75_021575 [Candidatus Parabeggiatoa sp.]|nr:hypothetical protein [Candidatus Parabeggiatoa sp.]
MNRAVDLSNVAGKNIEDLTTEQLCAIAWEAGHNAYLKAKKHGFRVTEFQNGQIVWVYPDGHTEPLKKLDKGVGG